MSSTPSEMRTESYHSGLLPVNAGVTLPILASGIYLAVSTLEGLEAGETQSATNLCLMGAVYSGACADTIAI